MNSITIGGCVNKIPLVCAYMINSKQFCFLQIFTTDNESKRRWKLLLFLFNASLFAFISALNLDAQFVMNVPLCWGATMIGIYSAIYSSVAAVGAMLFSKPMTYFLNDELVVVIALIISLAGTVYKFFVTTTVMMLASKYICLGTLIQEGSPLLKES